MEGIVLAVVLTSAGGFLPMILLDLLWFRDREEARKVLLLWLFSLACYGVAFFLAFAHDYFG